MELVENETSVAYNVLRFDSYSSSSDPLDVEFYRERLRLGKQFVCLTRGNRTLFCPSRFAGYEGNSRMRHLAFPFKNGRVTTPHLDCLLGKYDTDRQELEADFLARCAELGLEPAQQARKRGYWLLTGEFTSIDERPRTGGVVGFPDEISEEISFEVAAVQRVLVNRYERDPEARKACIAHYGGPICQVCRIDFGVFYPKIGQSFIHVHHLKPETLRQPGYKINPATELIPVCPNCHAMLHTDDPPLTRLSPGRWSEAITAAG